jgi:cytidylate kinase
VKFFLGATAEERGRRRYRELAAKGMDVDLARITTEIRERDHQDSSRALAPLVQAPDAAPIDSTGVDIPGVLDRMLHEIARRFPGVVR